MDNEDNKKNRKKIIFVLILLLLLLLCVKMCVDTQNKHSLTIIINDKDDNHKSINIYAGNEYKLEEPERAGYKFDGWTLESESSKINKNIFTMGEENTEIKAEWKPITYSVEFDSNLPDVSVEKTEYTIETATFELPVLDNKNGYGFEGWYDNNEYKGKSYTKIDEGSHGDKKLYAKWQLINYQITYKLNGGTVEYNNDTYTIETERFKINNPTKKGYIFLGWTSDNNKYPNKNVWIEKGSTGNKTYTANWSPTEYSIYYDLDGGTVSNSNRTNYTIETSTFKINNPTKKHYNFIGWTEETSKTPIKDISIKQGSTGDKNYKANWEPVKYIITYNLNGGKLQKNDIKEFNIETKTFNLPTPQKDGYEFVGWYDNPELTGENISKIEKGTTGNKTYYAKWNVVTYSINYELNGGTQSDNPPSEYTIETETFDLEIPVKTGYNFKGWFTNKDFKDETENSVKIGTTGNKTYYAKWEKIKDYKGWNIYDVLRDTASMDNEKSTFVSGEKGIDFSKTSSATNGHGIYTYSASKDDAFPTYYYRGNVDNNNVIFGGFCWKIVRTTETGGTKLVYNGVPTNGTCNNTGSAAQLKNTKFSLKAGTLAAGGYSLGTTYVQNVKKYADVAIGTIFAKDVKYENGQYTLIDKYVVDQDFYNNKFEILSKYHYTCLNSTDTCNEVKYVYYARDSDKKLFYIILSNGERQTDALFNAITNSSNTTKSNIRTFVDNWYTSNLTPYSDYIEDTVWCNDRSIPELGGWKSNGNVQEVMQYGAYNRNAVLFKPSLTCQSKNDRFTKSLETGNGLLDNSIGLLTLDETSLSGYVYFTDSISYLDNGLIWWTMSPGMVAAASNYTFVNYSISDHVSADFSKSGVRPSISLKYGTQVSDGNGTADNPFILE